MLKKVRNGGILFEPRVTFCTKRRNGEGMFYEMMMMMMMMMIMVMINDRGELCGRYWHMAILG